MFEQMILSAVGELKQTFLVQFCQLEKRLDFICENKQPDVIESGGVKNITNNYYEVPNKRFSSTKSTVPNVPKVLQRYVEAGLLDPNLQPNHLTWPQAALLAKDAWENVPGGQSPCAIWQYFGQLWNVSPQTLRSYFNRAMNQKKTLQFLDVLKQVHQTQNSVTLSNQ